VSCTNAKITSFGVSICINLKCLYSLTHYKDVNGAQNLTVGHVTHCYILGP